MFCSVYAFAFLVMNIDLLITFQLTRGDVSFLLYQACSYIYNELLGVYCKHWSRDIVLILLTIHIFTVQRREENGQKSSEGEEAPR